MGIRLAADLAYQHRTRLHTSSWFLIDNQPSVRFLTQPLCPTPGLALRQRAMSSLYNLINLSPTTTVKLVWCPAHVGIQDNEDANEDAKEATSTSTPQNLPLSLAAVRQLINAACATILTNAPSPSALQRLRGVYSPSQFRKALTDLPRHSATAIAQLRGATRPCQPFSTIST